MEAGALDLGGGRPLAPYERPVFVHGVEVVWTPKIIWTRRFSTSQVHGQHLMEPHRRRRLRKVMHVATAMPIMLLQLSVHLGVRGGDATRLMEIEGD